MIISKSERVAQYQAAARAGSVAYGYKNLRIHALAGLHEFVAGVVSSHLSEGGALLDLAAGSGAMALRLQDAGFRVSAADLVDENFKLGDRIEFFSLDLDKPFAERVGKTFDGIVGIEIIEHLENPRHFFRECNRLLRPGGKLILSTPNVDNPLSKALFVRSGTHLWFDDRDYRVQGHITPLSWWQLGKSAQENGFEVKLLTSFGDPFVHSRGSPRLRLLARLLKLVSAQAAALNGEILVAVFEKTAAA